MFEDYHENEHHGRYRYRVLEYPGTMVNTCTSNIDTEYPAPTVATQPQCVSPWRVPSGTTACISIVQDMTIIIWIAVLVHFLEHYQYQSVLSICIRGRKQWLFATILLPALYLILRFAGIIIMAFEEQHLFIAENHKPGLVTMFEILK